ncbi:hypothetical protein JK193_14220, partial [Gluconobacter wancherniae]|nr:hypothetical protein [Gluconobacter wancherniae]
GWGWGGWGIGAGLATGLAVGAATSSYYNGYGYAPYQGYAPPPVYYASQPGYVVPYTPYGGGPPPYTWGY